MKTDLLVALEGPSQGMAWPLRGIHVLGREGDVAVPDPALSRTHVQLRATRGHVRARELGSANGTRWGFGCLKRSLGTSWTRLPGRAVLEAGGGRYRLAATSRPRRARPAAAGRFVAVGVPVTLALALVPFAIGGPPWRWLMVIAPLGMAATQVPGTRRYEHRRGEKPADILTAAREGRAFHAEPVVPRQLTAMRSTALGGTGWAFAGPSAESNAIWLAGFLSAHNDPDVLRITSPWLTTHGNGLEVVFDPSPCAGPARDAVLVTWHPTRPPVWAAVLRAPAWARASLPWARALDADGTSGRLPLRVELESIVDTDDHAIRAGWGRPVDLAVTIGVAEGGPVAVDLRSDGPHALVAGMSGAGKSEFLTTWLLALALRNAPNRLQFILVDFKGGAAFDILRTLPHCVGVLTDLDEAATRRALASLRAQLRRREQLLREQAARDLEEYNVRAPEAVPILVVVIDEFRALADDHPDLLEQFLRLANQGRSLGVHLVVATQRPAGAVAPALRANMPLRVCLRVAETADSVDVLGVPAAATLENVPGRALVHSGTLTRVQVAWSGDSRRVASLVERIRSVVDGPPASPPWQPALPAVVSASHVACGVFAIADHPDELDQRPLTLPETGLLVLGAPGTGRTAAAHSAAAAALAQGDQVWLVSCSPAPHLTAAGPAFGGIVDPRQTRVVGMLLAHLARPGAVRRTLVIDDVETWIDTTDDLLGAGAASSALAVLLRSARATGVRAVVIGQPAQSCARWADPLRHRLLLSGADPSAALLAGLPREVAARLPTERIAGRGVLTPGGLSVQVVLQDAPATGGATPAHRIVALPERGTACRRAGRVVLGSSGTGQVDVPAGGSFAIVGPPGTGRTTTAHLVGVQHPEAMVLDGTAREITGPVIVTTTPGAWAGTFSGPLARLRTEATLVLLRPDLFPRLPGVDYSSELEPGGPGYGIVIHEGRSRAVRLARRCS